MKSLTTFLFKKIKMPNGKSVMVDYSDYKWLNQWKWHDYKGYAVRTIYLGGGRKNPKYKMVSMHRLIAGTPNNYQTDHINGNKLDNRRFNLRFATNSQNQMNKLPAKNNTSGVVGVRWKKQAKKWIALIIKNKKRIHLGYFNTKKEAVLARKKAEKLYFGKYAKL